MRKSITILTMLAAPLALAACSPAPEATEEVVATEAAAPEAAAPEGAADAAAAPAPEAAAEPAVTDAQSTNGGVQPKKM